MNVTCDLWGLKWLEIFQRGWAPVPAPSMAIHDVVIVGLKLRDAVLLVGGHQTNQTKRSEMKLMYPPGWEVSGCFCCLFFNLKKNSGKLPRFRASLQLPECLSCNLFVWIFPPPKVPGSTSSPSLPPPAETFFIIILSLKAVWSEQTNLQQHRPLKSQLLPKV